MQRVNPEEVGLSSARLARIDSVMQDFVQDDQMPGILTLVQRRGQVAHLGAFGMMDIEAQRPMPEDALFRIYSMTKPITSIALMMLYEDGRFGLNDPIARYIPAFKETKVYDRQHYVGLKLVPQERPITIHHLLTHTSGLGYGLFQDSPVELLYQAARPELFLRHEPLSETIERIARLPLLFQPGTGWRYSVATDVLGYLVQILADMPFADFLQEKILRPLGMVDTAFHVPAEKRDRLAKIYASHQLYDPYVLEPPAVPDVTLPTQSPSGGGGLLSTLADYLQFCQCLINGGVYEGGQLVSRKTLAWMTVNHVTETFFPLSIGPNYLHGYGFGLGFRVMMDLGQAHWLTSVGEYGWSGYAKTYFWIDPEEELIGIMMTQLVPAAVYPVQERFRNLVYQSIID